MNLKKSKNKLLRDSGALVFGQGGRMFKIPIMPAVFTEMKLEKDNFFQVKKDIFFSNYLIDVKFIGFIQITPRLTELEKNDGEAEIIRKYFYSAFAGRDDWPRETLLNLIPGDYFFRFLSEEKKGEEVDHWKDFFNGIFLPKSSCHGDFHAENVLLKDKKLYFIDWTRYEASSSRYFDLIDFFIFSQKEQGEGWMSFWKKALNTNPGELYGIEIIKDYLIAYAFWKISQELKTLYQRKKLSRQKGKKYLVFLDDHQKIIKDIKKDEFTR